METTALDPDIWDGLGALPVTALIRLIDTYLDNSLAIFGNLREAAAAGDTFAFRRHIHQLKGSSAALGVCAVMDACVAVEAGHVTMTVPELRAALAHLQAVHGQSAVALAAQKGLLAVSMDE